MTERVEKQKRLSLKRLLSMLMLPAILCIVCPASTVLAYDAPEFLESSFHENLAETGERVMLDLSALEEGYVAVSATSDRRLKFQVIQGEDTYNYDLSSDGVPGIFPLQSGDGSYRFRVMENVVDKKYAELYAAEAEVRLKDGFQPFLRPSTYVPYTRESDCVKKANELAKSASDEIDVVGAVYTYICGAVTYDRAKAESVKSGYLPDPDKTMETGKGICFDYASLAAAMLRSQGIPTKLIFGYVSPKDLYHAWNMFYTEESGWVTVSFEARADDWTRMDLTFSANGAEDSFIGDGSNYSDVYYY